MDYRTLYLVLFTTLLIQTAALLLTWRQNRGEIGLRDWGVSAVLMTSGALLVMLGLFFTRDAPAAEQLLASRLLTHAGSGLGSTGWMLAWLGIRRFYQRPVPTYWLVPAYGIVFTLVLWPGNHLPGWRVALVGLAIAAYAALIVWELNRDETERNLITTMGSLAMSTVVATWLARSIAAATDLQRIGGWSEIDLVCIYSSIVMSMVFTISLILLTNQRVHRQLRDQATIDVLTGTLNRRAFFDASKPLLAALRRGPVSLAVAVLDLDHFKQINDTHGHAAGDLTLSRFAAVAGEALREGDVFARYGGEEFVILLQDSSREQAVQAIERLREAWCRHELASDGQPLAVTFSAGISHATGPSELTLEDLLKAADRALYEAKEGGRDRVVIAGMADDMTPAPTLGIPVGGTSG